VQSGPRQPAMIDTNQACPTVPAPGFGTVGQSSSGRDSARDTSGTSTLKALALLVLARDIGRDRTWDRPATRVPAPPPLVPSPQAPVPSLSDIPGVPRAWCEGVALLATLQAPPTIPPRRWAVLAATSSRLQRDHGAALHATGWDALDLFGLDATAPATNPAGWSLAWLLGEHGEVLDVSPGVIGMRWGPDGARLAYRRNTSARVATLPAWNLPGVSA